MKKTLSLFFLLLPSFLFAEQDTEIPPVNFGGGLNVYNAPNDIADNESPDMSNFVNSLDGSSFKRNGSQRYISQAYSSNPVTSLYVAYISTNSSYRRWIFAANRDQILVSSNPDSNPLWVQIATVVPFQHWNFVTMLNKVIFTPEEMQNDVMTFDANVSSVTPLFSISNSTQDIKLRGKYPLVSKNYFILANVQDVGLFPSTTFYPSRAYYSLLVQPSSMTQLRYLEYRTDDGEPIMGAAELNGFVHFPKQTTIGELNFTVLNLSDRGGDQSLLTRVSGFGLYAPRTFKSIGEGYILGAKDGIRFWDGGQKSRLRVEEESRVVSLKVKPIIDRCIKAGTWAGASSYYYPKKQWYILSFEDPIKFPKGRHNSILVYDLQTTNWYPFVNWNSESFISLDGIGDKGQLVYGDSNDGYVYLADLDNAPNDARKEMVLDPMESTSTWSRGIEDKQNVKEGTTSIKLGTLSVNSFVSSTTLMRVLNIGEWPDKTEILKSDKLSFKVYVTSLGNVQSLRADMEVNDIQGEFDSNFTSVTFSSASLTASNTSWTTLEVSLSSFPIRNDWVDLSSETVSTASNFIVYGLRFVLTGVDITSASIDDVRIVQSKENPLNAYRYTKQFNFGTTNKKSFRQLILNRDLPPDSRFRVDAFSDFGTGNPVPIFGGFNKDLYCAAFNSTNTITRIDPIDFSIKDSTISNPVQPAFDFQYLTKDQNFIYGGDKVNDRVAKISIDSMTLWISSFGAFGSGTTNFNTIQEISQDDNSLYIADVNNQRIVVLNKANLSFIASFGTLGTGATSYHVPTGVDVDDKYIYVGDEGNSALKKVSKTTYTVVAIQPLNINTVADISVRVDENFLYDAFNSQSETDFTKQNVVLEKRYKDSLKLISKTLLRPLNNSLFESTYTIQGDISTDGDFIYVTFTDDQNRNGNWYIQKLLKSDFSIVREYKTPKSLSTCAAVGIDFKPKKQNQFINLGVNDGAYLQLKYSENELDNSFRLYSQGFLIENKGVHEQ